MSEWVGALVGWGVMVGAVVVLAVVFLAFIDDEMSDR